MKEELRRASNATWIYRLEEKKLEIRRLQAIAIGGKNLSSRAYIRRCMFDVLRELWTHLSHLTFVINFFLRANGYLFLCRLVIVRINSRYSTRTNFQHFSFKDTRLLQTNFAIQNLNWNVAISKFKYRNTRRRNWIFQVKPSPWIFEIQIRILNLDNFTSSHWQYPVPLAISLYAYFILHL